jgi:nucleotide-binding universal stress UspA family protein
MFKHILLPTDGSELAQAGLGQGVALAATLGAKVTIVTVTEPLPVYLGAEAAAWSAGDALASFDKDMAASAAKVLEAARATAAASQVPAETIHVPRTPPADAIVEVARSQGCDLIVMASHGRRGVRRLILGSQTSEVLAHSPAPVLVIPADA